MAKFHGKVPVGDQKVLAGVFSGVEVDFEIDTDAKKIYLTRAGSSTVTAIGFDDGEIPDPPGLEADEPEDDEDDEN